MSVLRAESDRLMERMRASEANVAELETDLAAAQEQVATKRAEADRYGLCPELRCPCASCVALLLHTMLDCRHARDSDED